MVRAPRRAALSASRSYFQLGAVGGEFLRGEREITCDPWVSVSRAVRRNRDPASPVVHVVGLERDKRDHQVRAHDEQHTEKHDGQT
jgi:hypothetical protein